MPAHDPGVGKEHVQPPVLVQGLCNHALDGFFVRCVELPRMHVHARVQALDLAHVCLQVLAVVVTHEYRLGPVGCKVVRAGAPYAHG